MGDVHSGIPKIICGVGTMIDAPVVSEAEMAGGEINGLAHVAYGIAV